MKQNLRLRPRKIGAGASADKSQDVLKYTLNSKETKAMLEQLSEDYKRPVPSAKEVRAMLDRALGNQTLTEALYKMRQEE